MRAGTAASAALAGLWAWGAGASASPEPSAGPEPVGTGAVEVRADTVQLSEGRAEGEGHVIAVLAGQTVTGERFVLDVDRGVLVVEEGAWERSEGTLKFRRAEVDLGGAAAAVVEGRFVGSDGPFVLTGAALDWREEEGGAGVWSGTDVSFSMCGCEPGPWSVDARRVTARLDDVATFAGAWIRVCDLPVLPVPWGMVPLTDRRTGFLVPRVGWGRDGVQVSTPFFVAAGDRADVTVEPEWRRERGLRGLVEGRAALAPGQDAVVRAAGGWDTQQQAGRGALDVEHGWAPGRLRTATDVLWLSDLDYLADYGGDFLTRTTPWAESRAVLGFADGRIESDVFQGESVHTQRPFSGIVRMAGRPAGPLAVSVGARTDVDLEPGAEVASPWGGFEPGEADARVVGDAEASTGRTVGPARVEAQVGGRMVRWQDDDAWGEGRVGVRAVGEGWTGLSSAGLLLHEVGVDVRASGASTVRGVRPTPRLPDEVLEPEWSVGPVARTRWLSPVGVPVSVELAAPWTPDGWRPMGRVRVGVGDVGARAQADPDLQAGRVWWDDGIGRVSAGLTRATGPSLEALPSAAAPPSAADGGSTLLLSSAAVAWTLPSPLSEWRTGWRGLADLDEPRFLSHGPTLAFTSRCECLSVAASATWSADRPVPDVGLAVDLR